MLREVHGRPQLYIPQAKDVGPPWGHHRRHLLLVHLECEVDCCGHATSIIAFGELATLKEEVTEEAPDAKKSIGSFEPTESSKEVLIDPGSAKGKTVRVGTTLSSE